MRTTRQALVLVVIGVVSACGFTGTATRAPTTPNAPVPSSSPAVRGFDSPPPSGFVPSPRPTTAWERALGNIDDNGRYSLEAALTLFATAYGPLPGVEVEQDLSGVTDRTAAIAAVMGHADELSAEQRAAIDAYLAPPSDADEFVIPPVAESANTIALARLDPGTKQALENAAKDYRQQIASKLGRDFAGEIKVFFKDEFGPKTKYGADAAADAWSDWPGGVFGDCRIRVFLGGQVGEPTQLLATIAHETFHCFQLDAFRTPDSYGIEPPWIVEGQATWAQEELVSGSDLDEWWDRYLTVQIPLTMRAYDAVGFYAHLAETGVDPWTIFQDTWAAGADNILAFKQAKADSGAFLDSWASSVMRQPNRSRAWDTTGPGIPPADEVSFVPPWFGLADGSSIDLSAAFFDNNVRMLQLKTDLVHVSIEGHGRLSDWDVDTTDLGDVWFCVSGHECEPKCPDDIATMPKVQGNIRDTVAIASTGGLDGTIGRAVGRDLRDESCATPEPTPEPTADEFCTRYKAYWAWASGQGEDISRGTATEIDRRFTDMKPYAPTQLVGYVDLIIRIYHAYAVAPDPYQVPAVELKGVEQIPTALRAMHQYCGMPAPF